MPRCMLCMITQALVAGTVLLLASTTSANAQSLAATDGPGAIRANALEAAQRDYYNARYVSSAEITREPCVTEEKNLAACELRTAALHFQIRTLLGQEANKEKAWKQCAACPELFSAFKAALTRGQMLARATLLDDPTDDETLFLLGKLDLNYVWLQLGTIGHKTGWDEYWEARRAIEKVLMRQPTHVRARVAWGWIDYIVSTKMPRGTRWLLGGANKKRGLLAIREAAGMEADFFTRTEARFGLWDMQVRERDTAGAFATAGILIRDFPENQELRRFIEAHRSPESSAGALPAR